MIRRSIFIFFLLLPLMACANREDVLPTLAPTAHTEATNTTTEVGATSTTPAAPVDSPSPTAVLPTPTPPPLAALVNDQPILLASYEKELARYEQALAELENPAEDTENYRQIVLDMLIEHALIAQAAQVYGVEVTPEMVDASLAELQATAGNPGNYEAWLEANQYSEEEFREALRVAMLNEQIVSLVTADVPFRAEQVRARYLQVDDLALAQTLLEQIRAGDDFAFHAQQHSLDRLTGEYGGDLGFFTRWSLLVPELAEVAFSLQPSEVSDVITLTDEEGHTTYYLIQVIEQDPQRTLTGDMRHTLLTQTFESWLAEQWAQANIVRFVDTDA